jgi:hypothetical protein
MKKVKNTKKRNTKGVGMKKQKTTGARTKEAPVKKVPEKNYPKEKVAVMYYGGVRKDGRVAAIKRMPEPAYNLLRQNNFQASKKVIILLDSSEKEQQNQLKIFLNFIRSDRNIKRILLPFPPIDPLNKIRLDELAEKCGKKIHYYLPEHKYPQDSDIGLEEAVLEETYAKIQKDFLKDFLEHRLWT